jgi:hypothetical protein
MSRKAAVDTAKAVAAEVAVMEVAAGAVEVADTVEEAVAMEAANTPVAARLRATKPPTTAVSLHAALH